MYLKRIVAHGFKSFADKLNIDFESGISGIVGPNGSGKSNVVDAVRWVLGEQSVKALRGDGNMTDVIFSGSGSRRASNQASITLIFDNSDNYINLPYTEISIKRQVYNDGTSEYYLNNERSRLKDITSILLDTGIAKESFNIISQGKVDEIITSKPIDRRVIFEEAAGVLKYKMRKTDAIRKLDRTNDNMKRVEDIIGELEIQVGPLKKQKEKAIIYKEKTKELKDVEIALLAREITDINVIYKQEKERIEILNKELLELTSTNSSNEAVISKYKLDLIKVEEELQSLNKELLLKTKLVEQINSKKQIILERKKYQVEDSKLHTNLVVQKERELNLNNTISELKRTTNNIVNTIKEVKIDIDKYNKSISKLKLDRTNYENELKVSIKNGLILSNKVDTLKHSIDSNASLPYAVKQVLTNPKLSGIEGSIGDLIEVDENNSKAISIALGASVSAIITKREIDAKDAINYLKNNNVGRATFYPIDIIKGRYLDTKSYDLIKSVDGFVDVASNLVKTNPIYHNIINYHLGNVIVTTNINSATNISKMLNNSKRIVTLDGDVINVGGSLTGGSVKAIKNIISDKYELETTINLVNKNVNDQKILEEKINEIDYNLTNYEDKLYLVNKDLIMKENLLSSNELQLDDFTSELDKVKNEIVGTNSILSNSLSTEEETVLNEYYQAIDNKKVLENNINNLASKKDELKTSLEEYEFSLRRENSKVYNLNKELKALEIEVNRKDVKIDNYLNVLNETYSLTYENAIQNYELKISLEDAKIVVVKLKSEIKTLGEVNLGAIEEYDRVSERYEFLLSQKSDLDEAINTLLDIIKEMDEIMIVEFKETFDRVNENFKETFKELFKGGKGELKLTDPTNLLETGIEIVASPPGKKLTSISLLSGGEKTFTAISLLFAILKSRPVPFCILDEVEAALDDANVDSFGEYITKMKNKTQFILITHKKKTMEFADILYGITMQESGVSKLVSVKLEDLK